MLTPTAAVHGSLGWRGRTLLDITHRRGEPADWPACSVDRCNTPTYGEGMTTAVVTRTWIGTCRRNSQHRFRAEATHAAYCPAYCPTCEPIESEAYGQPWTQRAMIAWSGVKGRVTKTACTEVCHSAKCNKCACECGGTNHGKSLGLAR